jgi:GNAT superfamily N-acetyltransferase
MPIATRHRDDPSPSLEPLDGLVITRADGAADMATIMERDAQELQQRLDNGHRAYVAWMHGAPAAWGWVATSTARIGELGTSFAVPPGERYLWNFVTHPAHRGRGIYPRLLDAIVRAESRDATGFWVGYAPENHASGTGIQRAGFTSLAELSFDANGQAALRDLVPGGAAAVSRLLGVPIASTLSPCWRCVRAGRASMSCPPTRCTCDYQRPTSGCAA